MVGISEKHRHLVIVCKHVLSGGVADVHLLDDGDCVCGECYAKLPDAVVMEDLATVCSCCLGRLLGLGGES